MFTSNNTCLEGLPPDESCSYLHKLNVSCICSFVRATNDCHIVSGYLEYNELVYCSLGDQLVPLAVVLLFLWLVVLFVSLAVSADDFFCPSLVVISKTLHLSDNVAGVTLLAFGNGAPDVFSAIAAVKGSRGDVSLAFSALLGAGVFLTSVVAGSVCIAQPFKIMERPFLRDVIFYIATVYMTFCILYDGTISLGESIAYILLYVVYVALVVIARLIYQKQKQKDKDSNKRLPGLAGSLSVSDSINAGVNDEDTLDHPVYTPTSRSHAHHEDDEERPYRQIDENTPLVGSGEISESYSPYSDFLCAISPVDVEDWRESGPFNKAIAVIKGIPKFILGLTAPVVDYEAPKHNWNKYLNTMHCVISPLMATYLAKPGIFLHYIRGVFPVWAIILLFGCVLAVAVFITSSHHEPPRYHWVFAYVGFITAVLWIQNIATEVVNVLQTFGVIFDLSDAIIGLTFLAWGNSIGDMIADITVARQGYPRAGISACYGGPMFNLLLGIGIPFTLVTAQQGGPVKVSLSPIEILLITSLLFNLVFALIVVPFILKFQMGKKLGFILFAFYGLFLLMALLMETHVIKSTF